VNGKAIREENTKERLNGPITVAAGVACGGGGLLPAAIEYNRDG